VDTAGGALLALTAVLWTAAGIFARSQHRHDPGRERFFAFWAATLAGNVGLVLAWDLLGFYLAFAVMTFSAWGLVVHDRSEAAVRAGRVYIVLALVGEVAILSALFALGAAAGGGVLLGFELSEAWVALGRGAPLVAGLAVAGFGVKAGLVPLHVWLPLAHPVAPTAASALLSGVMIKAGLLGWLRILPAGGETVLPGVGEALVVVGVIGAFYGVVAGLAQEDPKTVLAYSSVSQMGYLAIGTGLVVLLADASHLALGAVLLFALHHGLAKGALFLSVGVAERVPAGARKTGSGRGTRARWGLRAGVALSALALAGAPLTSGAVAKGALKAGLGELGGAWYAVLDPLLLVAALGTALLMVRFGVVLERKIGTAAEKPGAAASAGDDLAGALPGSTLPGSTLPGSTLPGSTTPGPCLPGPGSPGSCCRGRHSSSSERRLRCGWRAPFPSRTVSRCRGPSMGCSPVSSRWPSPSAWPRWCFDGRGSPGSSVRSTSPPATSWCP
jgi:hydrogenase-4 component B